MITLKSLSVEDFCRQEIMEAARNHHVVLLTDTNGEEDKVLVRKAIEAIKSCWSYVRPGIEMNLVRLYINGVLDTNPDEFRVAMAHERRYAKYLSLMVGALLQHRVFQCSTNVLARNLSKKMGICTKTTERYLYQGMKKKQLIEIFMEVDRKIAKNQSDLCSDI